MNLKNVSDYLSEINAMKESLFNIDNIKKVAFKKYAIDFIIDSENSPIIEALLMYFMKSSESKLDLKKGLCLIGNIGTGKTLIMKLFKELHKQYYLTYYNEIYDLGFRSKEYDNNYELIESEYRRVNNNYYGNLDEIKDIQFQYLLNPYREIFNLREQFNALFIPNSNGRLKHRDEYDMIDARIIVRLFDLHGYDIYRKNPSFCNEDAINFVDNNICIDELGLEPKIAKHWGEPVDVLAELILDRYNIVEKQKTHFITNLSIENLKERYGDRITSRLRQMVNVVYLTGQDRRK